MIDQNDNVNETLHVLTKGYNFNTHQKQKGHRKSTNFITGKSTNHRYHHQKSIN